MTTETETSEAPANPFADAECHNCKGPVKRRRPSLSGAHFCSKPGCQKEKHRFHYRRRTLDAAAQDAKRADVHRQQFSTFVHAALHGDRVDCANCGRPSVVPGYSHPVPDWTAACNPPGSIRFGGDKVLAGELMRAVFPS